MDEPFASLDEPTRHALQQELLDLWQDQRRTIVFVTHNVEEAVAIADNIVILTDGRVSREITMENPNPRDRLDRGFVDEVIKVRKAFC